MPSIGCSFSRASRILLDDASQPVYLAALEGRSVLSMSCKAFKTYTPCWQARQCKCQSAHCRILYKIQTNDMLALWPPAVAAFKNRSVLSVA